MSSSVAGEAFSWAGVALPEQLGSSVRSVAAATSAGRWRWGGRGRTPTTGRPHRAHRGGPGAPGCGAVAVVSAGAGHGGLLDGEGPGDGAG